MKNKFVLFLACLILQGCVTIPTSPQADLARTRVLPSLREELAVGGFAIAPPVYLRGFKEEKTLEVWAKDQKTKRYKLFKSYPVCTFSGTLGPKTREGDKQTPEGFYSATVDRMNPDSRFYLSFDIGYPNQFDEAHGYTGKALMIHGGCISTGCYAMGDDAIEEIYVIVENALRAGQREVPIDLFPFRMTDENMERHRDSPHNGFWLYLKQGYDAFEAQNPTNLPESTPDKPAI